ncbi:hypothetical protein FACS1894176_08460 [Bacteroidia bacterium]|nr:hypothetical protein FACS1894176_08460 [Bacteroidia bacterium]
MKKNVLFLVIAVIVLLLLNTLLLYKYKQQEKKQWELRSQIYQLSDKESVESGQLKQAILLQQASEALLCPDVAITNPKSQEIETLRSLLKKNQPILFFRFKETDCDACVQNATKTLSEIAEHFPDIDIIILSGYGNVRQFYAYAQTKKHSLGIYNVNHFPIPVEEQEVPYFFVVTPELKIQNIFIPDKADPTFTTKYLDCMMKKYWSLDKLKHHHADNTPDHS